MADRGKWHEDYICAHCGRRVTVSVNAAWPEQCPHCRVWQPTLTMASPPRAGEAVRRG